MTSVGSAKATVEAFIARSADGAIIAHVLPLENFDPRHQVAKIALTEKLLERS
jgi:hypothetical protein